MGKGISGMDVANAKKTIPVNNGRLKQRIKEEQYDIITGDRSDYYHEVGLSTDDIFDIINEMKNEYIKKCKPNSPCSCVECEWYNMGIFDRYF
jgi:hypothetical protein